MSRSEYSREHILDNKGNIICREIKLTETYVDNIYLTSLVQSNALMTYARLTTDLSLIYTTSNTFLFRELSYLKLNFIPYFFVASDSIYRKLVAQGDLSPQDEDMVFATIYSDVKDDCSSIICRWIPPSDSKLVLCIRVIQDGREFVASSLYLFIIDPNTGYTGILPLPNIYDNGELCLNNSPRGSTYQGLVSNAISLLFKSQYSHHLAKDMVNTVALFTYTETSSQLVCHNWKKYCYEVNNIHLNTYISARYLIEDLRNA